jgi:hypothetical protein
MSIMKEVIIFFDPIAKNCTNAKAVNAIAEVDELDTPFAAEVLWLRDQIGEMDSRKLLSALEQKEISHSYSDEIDALTFSFGGGFQSVNQRRAILTMEFNDDVLVKLVLKEKI